jgi:protease-4
MDQVDQLGRGHVYSGIDAKDLKLVDEFGGLREALADVRSQSRHQPASADLDMRVFPRQRRLVDILLEQVLPEPGDKGLRARIPPAATPRPSSRSPSAPPSPASPSSLLFLPPDQALALLPGMVEIE